MTETGTETTPASWEHANRDLLVAELTVLRARLRDATSREGLPTLAEAEAGLAALRAGSRLETALDQVCSGFGLTPFERSVLLLAAGPELIAEVGDELLAAGGSHRATFGLALAALPEAHWSAVTPAGALRRWNLVELLDPASPTRSPLMIDERVLHHLAGAGHLDARLAVLARPLRGPEWLPDALEPAVREVLAGWARDRKVLLHGPQPDNVRAVAAAAAGAAALNLLEIAAADLPADPAARDRMLRLMERETVLAGQGWAVDVESGSPEELAARGRALAGVDVPVVLIGGTGEVPRWDDVLPVAVERLDVRSRRSCCTTPSGARGRRRAASITSAPSRPAFSTYPCARRPPPPQRWGPGRRSGPRA